MPSVPLPNEQDITARLQNSLQQAWRGAGTRLVAPAYVLSLPVESALSRVRYFTKEHIQVAIADLTMTVGPCPRDESWLFRDIAVGSTGGNPDFRLKLITDGAQSLNIQRAILGVAGPGAADSLLRQPGASADDSWIQPFKIFAGMSLKVQSIADLAVGDVTRFDIILEIQPPALNTAGEEVGNPTFVEA